ncbi:MAG: hypothetical protein ABI234_00920 [Ktedonobacteraceae bacterium]
MSEQNQQDIPIACSLTAQDLSTRHVEVEEMMRGIEAIKELADGYMLKFPGSADWASTLLQFVIQERACCPFFTFELHFEPQEGPTWLTLRGPEGTKGFVAEMIGTG